MKLARTAYGALAAMIWLLSLTRGAHAAAPSVGQCLTSSEKWNLLRAERKLLAARAELSVCSQPSCPGDIREECGLRLTEVNAMLPSVVFAVVDAEEHALGAVRVSIDGNPSVEATDAPILFDPGVHRARFERDSPEFQVRGLPHYHAWAFGTTRQLGAAFELAAQNLAWLNTGGDEHVDHARAAFVQIATLAKSFILKGARMANSGKPPDASALFDQLAEAWETGMRAADIAFRPG